jgi:hypothetical protein
MSNISVIYVGHRPESTLEKVMVEAYKILGEKNKGIFHPDLILVKGENSIGIQQVKELIRHISRKPYQAKKSVAIIHPGQLMTTEAQNALLKTLEEPPDFASLFITTTNIQLLLPTIRSRCQIMTSTDANVIAETPGDLVELINQPTNIRLATIDKWLGRGKVKGNEVAKWIDAWILTYRATDPKLLDQLLQAKQMLKANVTPQHVLDCLMISYR